MAPAISQLESQSQGLSTWEDFNLLHRRLLADFNRPDFFTSGLNHSSLLTSSSGSGSGSDAVQIRNEEESFNVVVDSPDFKPDELKVSTYDNVLKIEGRHVEEGSLENGNKYVSRQFSRSYTLPSDCKVEEMKSSFGGGKLTVKVPKVKPAALEEPVNRSVPIEVKSPRSSGDFTTTTRSRKSSTSKVEESKTTETSSVRHVKINQSDKDAGRDTAAAAAAATASRSSPPPPPKIHAASSFFNRGNSLFDRWTKPIQLFDEDFFVDSFWNSSSCGSSGDRKTDDWIASKKMTHPVGSNSISSQVQVSDNEDRFEFIIPTDDYAPQELKVTVLDDVLKIEGKHVDESEGKKVSKQFSRSYVLPRHVYKMDQVESCLTKTKNLVVKVPKTRHQKTGEITVPIKML